MDNIKKGLDQPKKIYTKNIKAAVYSNSNYKLIYTLIQHPCNIILRRSNIQIKIFIMDKIIWSVLNKYFQTKNKKKTFDIINKGIRKL